MHALRQGNGNEVAQGSVVNLTLADDEKVPLMQDKAGAILTKIHAQPVLPLGALVAQLGYEFKWTRKGCRLTHPYKPEVMVVTKSACPEVRELDVVRLIAELDEKKLGEAVRPTAI